MKIKTLALGCLLQITLMAGAQEAERPVIKPVQWYIGIQPGFLPTFIDQYDRQVWDINLIPLTVEYAVNRHWALRVHSIYNLGVGAYNQAAQLSNYGFEIAMPFYLSLKNSEEGHRGFFIGPAITPDYNVANKYYTFGFGGEAGFSFLFGHKWSFSLSAQAGIKLQKYPNEGFYRYIQYAIPVVGIGIWL